MFDYDIVYSLIDFFSNSSKSFRISSKISYEYVVLAQYSEETEFFSCSVNNPSIKSIYCSKEIFNAENCNFSHNFRFLWVYYGNGEVSFLDTTNSKYCRFSDIKMLSNVYNNQFLSAFIIQREDKLYYLTIKANDDVSTISFKGQCIFKGVYWWKEDLKHQVLIAILIKNSSKILSVNRTTERIVSVN